MSDAANSLPEQVTFTLDGREVRAEKGEMLIAAAERAGTFIPRFCYHPRMKSVGVCRMCLVEVSGPRGASLQPSCFVEVQDGSTVVTDSEKVKKAQDGVLEFLLINHPLDCPVCDKGGECPLQDQTLAYGPGESRFVEEKRHFEKPIAISELVLLDRERCIQCSRCTRFADEVAGEAQIDFIGRGEHLEVNTFPELPFSSYFSGNTVQICPVGALTASPYRFAARPWDLDQVESTCSTCSVGCRVAVQSSSNRATRMLGIDTDPVNHGWLCDKGRFALDAVNRDDRLTEPLVRKEGALVSASWYEALEAVAGAIERTTEDGPDAVGVIGGARLTNEGAYAWAKLAKGIVGTDSVDAQVGDGLPAEVAVALARATIDQACEADTVIVLSGDVREELPVLFLRLRSAVVDAGLSLVELSPRATSLTPYAEVSLHYAPGDAADLARALLDPEAPSPNGVDPAMLARARQLAGAGPVVVRAGRPALAEDGALVGEAIQVLAGGLPGARFLSGLRRGNVHGALDMGLAPGLLPGRVSLEAGRSWFGHAWGSVPDRAGRDAAGILAAAADDPAEGPRVRTLVLLGADPLSDFPDRRLAELALDRAEFVVAVASSPGPVTERADVVLPAAEAHERSGTTTNLEGRVSRVAQKLVPPGQSWPDWMIAAELAVHLGSDLGLASAGEVWDEIERLAPAYRGISRAVLDDRASADGVVAPLPATRVVLDRGHPAPLDPIAVPGVESVEWQGAPPRVGLAELSASPAGTTDAGRSTGGSEGGEATEDRPSRPELLSRPVAPPVPHVSPGDRYSVRVVASRTLYDRGAAVSAVPALAGLVAADLVHANPRDLDDLGVVAGGPVRLRGDSASLVLTAVPDASLPRHVVAVDFNVPLGEGTAADLIDVGQPVVQLRMETP
jgi:NADH-quinone oxidoreductase subunit G